MWRCSNLLSFELRFMIGGAIRFGFGIIIGGFFRSWGWGYNRFDWGGHALFINNARWGRTWMNRGAYVHMRTCTDSQWVNEYPRRTNCTSALRPNARPRSTVAGRLRSIAAVAVTDRNALIVRRNAAACAASGKGSAPHAAFFSRVRGFLCPPEDLHRGRGESAPICKWIFDRPL